MSPAVLTSLVRDVGTDLPGSSQREGAECQNVWETLDPLRVGILTLRLVSRLSQVHVFCQGTTEENE